MSEHEATVDIETDIHPTESLENLKRAIRNLFPDAEFDEMVVNKVKAKSKDLGTLKEKVANQKILTAARGALMRNIRDGHFYFIVAKQAAFANKVSFDESGPLGDILVIIRTEDPEKVIEHLTYKSEHDDEGQRGE